MVAIAPKIQSPPVLAQTIPPVPTLPEQRITYCDRTWEQFKLIEQGSGSIEPIFQSNSTKVGKVRNITGHKH